MEERFLRSSSSLEVSARGTSFELSGADVGLGSKSAWILRGWGRIMESIFVLFLPPALQILMNEMNERGEVCE